MTMDMMEFLEMDVACLGTLATLYLRLRYSHPSLSQAEDEDVQATEKEEEEKRQEAIERNDKNKEQVDQLYRLHLQSRIFDKLSQFRALKELYLGSDPEEDSIQDNVLHLEMGETEEEKGELLQKSAQMRRLETGTDDGDKGDSESIPYDAEIERIFNTFGQNDRKKLTARQRDPVNSSTSNNKNTTLMVHREENDESNSDNSQDEDYMMSARIGRRINSTPSPQKQQDRYSLTYRPVAFLTEEQFVAFQSRHRTSTVDNSRAPAPLEQPQERPQSNNHDNDTAAEGAMVFAYHPQRQADIIRSADGKQNADAINGLQRLILAFSPSSAEKNWKEVALKSQIGTISPLNTAQSRNMRPIDRVDIEDARTSASVQETPDNIYLNEHSIKTFERWIKMLPSKHSPAFWVSNYKPCVFTSVPNGCNSLEV
ncbi:MAG: hypothetical protein J3R72DRAFT_488733 [Linnemannia gamsii]|nr:MAG: hypothetical protein J3R72DRAFT_488733 [Linnemannia gamsii]